MRRHERRPRGWHVGELRVRAGRCGPHGGRRTTVEAGSTRHDVGVRCRGVDAGVAHVGRIVTPATCCGAPVLPEVEAAAGYTQQQIIEAFIGGCFLNIGGDGCEAIRDLNLDVVLPERPGPTRDCVLDELERHDEDGAVAAPDDEEEQLVTTAVLIGTGELVTTDKGRAATCTGTVEDVRATIFPDQRVEIVYTRLVESGLPPDQETGSGDTSQFVECIDANRRSIHRGTLDVAAGTVGGFENDGVSADLSVTVSDAGLATMTGVITVVDFLQEWTLDISMEECTSNC